MASGLSGAAGVEIELDLIAYPIISPHRSTIMDHREASEINDRIRANREALYKYKSPTVQPCARQHTDQINIQGDSTTELTPVQEETELQEERADRSFLYFVLILIVTSVPWWVGVVEIVGWIK